MTSPLARTDPSGGPRGPAPAPWDHDGLRLHVLATGSKGNASLVETPEGIILVDCGISCRQVIARTRACGLDPLRIRAILVTHEHVDHVAGVRVTAGKLGVPVYASLATLRGARWPSEVSGTPLQARRPLEVAGVRVIPFSVPHDAPETLGFRFERAGDAIGFCTDIGHLTDEAGEYLSDARILALESNHDVAMLSDYPGYPASLKRRIGGDDGHLSNAQASEGLARLVTSRTQAVVGMHISEHTNLPGVCRDALERGRDLLAPAQGRRLQIIVAGEARPVAGIGAES